MAPLKAGKMAAGRTLAGRAVYVRVHPRTRNLEEGRQVLRELETFGPVEMFRSLKYDPSSASLNASLAIYLHKSSASALLSSSPIKYTPRPTPSDDPRIYSSMLPTGEEENPWKAEGIDEMLDLSPPPGDRPTHLPIESAHPPSDTPPRSEPEPPEDQNPRYTPPSTDPPLSYRSPWGTSPPSDPHHPQTPSRTFTLTASPSNLNHADYISRQPYYRFYSPMADPVQSACGIAESFVKKKKGGGERPPGLMAIWREGLGGEGKKAVGGLGPRGALGEGEGVR
ncbi:hypothetical protein FGG08_003811 [Glutinoglossum americanum]|uniref:Uncharacterized protein n=1 Tax=Glutinoglossum americanum TaxID=1670608 RepID=A0A9P8KXP8_9PEZI|nr:hypothetical protein FGG08_003811 [Glutinoglossum americanum]